MKRIINMVRGWMATHKRNPRHEATVQPRGPLTVEEVQEKVRHHAPKMNIWGNHIRWMYWAPNEKGQRHFYGHKPRGSIKVGDWIAQDLSGGRTGILEIVSIEWQRDPDDMFFGFAKDVDFLPEGMDPEDLCLPPKPSPSDPRMTRARFVPLGG